MTGSNGNSEHIISITEDLLGYGMQPFEGPLDLLLYLIKRDEIDIYDIPISRVVHEYISYLDAMEQLDLSIAGEYLLMAALLLNIKARMLLPVPEIDTDEIEDPRQELVDIIVEYKLFKKVGERLARFREKQENLFPKGSFPESESISNQIVEELVPVDLYSLFRTAWEMLRNEDMILPGYEGDEVDVGQRMEFIVNFLSDKKRVRFIDLFEGQITTMFFIATFIAILELVREKSIRIYQRSPYSDIWISPNSEEEVV